MNRLESHSLEQTLRYSQILGEVIGSQSCIALTGTLGTGKTSFVKGLALGIGINDRICSPTFSILHEHDGPVALLHSDLYRLEEPDLYNLGLEEMFEMFDGVVVVEWADKFEDLLPNDRLTIAMAPLKTGREWRLSATGPNAEDLLHRWLDNIYGE